MDSLPLGWVRLLNLWQLHRAPHGAGSRHADVHDPGPACHHQRSHTFWDADLQMRLMETWARPLNAGADWQPYPYDIAPPPSCPRSDPSPHPHTPQAGVRVGFSLLVFTPQSPLQRRGPSSGREELSDMMEIHPYIQSGSTVYTPQSGRWWIFASRQWLRPIRHY